MCSCGSTAALTEHAGVLFLILQAKVNKVTGGVSKSKAALCSYGRIRRSLLLLRPKNRPVVAAHFGVSHTTFS